nr:RecName: Full=Verectin [Aloe vera]
DEDNVLLT